MEITILGCGPSGLITALAMEQAGFRDIKILSRKKEKSPMNGAQYLHKGIPGISETGDHFAIKYVKHGTAQCYAKKVYGDWDAPVSWHNFSHGLFDAWSLQPAYNRLWERYAHLIEEYFMSGPALQDYMQDYTGHIISTIPRKALCLADHQFDAQQVYITNTAPEEVDYDTIVYNGTKQGGWYRASLIRGHGSTEYRAGPDTPFEPNGYKPTTHDCDCFADEPGLTFLGRFGEWNKRVLMHNVYESARETARGLVWMHEVRI